MNNIFRAIFIACLVLLCPVWISAIECPKQPEQSRKDWNAEVSLAVAKIGPAKGGDLTIKTRNATRDLLGKLPSADKLYLEQMMYATYCSALRDDKLLTESEKARRVKGYNAEVRKAFLNTQLVKNHKIISSSAHSKSAAVQQTLPEDKAGHSHSDESLAKNIPGYKNQVVSSSPGSVIIQGDSININAALASSASPPPGSVSPKMFQTDEGMPPLLPPQERLLELIAGYQKQFASSKLIISRDDGTLFFDGSRKLDVKISLFTDLYGTSDEKNAERFEELILSIPNEYLRLIPEMRLDSPYVVNVTGAGINYLKTKYQTGKNDGIPTRPVDRSR